MPITPDVNDDYTLQAKTKAVVFTHVDFNHHDIAQHGQVAMVDRYAPLFERYLKCRNVGLVYLYLSMGAEEIIRMVEHEIVEGQEPTLAIPPNVLIIEGECAAILQLAEARARETYPGKSLKFIHVTTTQLAAILKNLHEIDPNLFGFLFGSRLERFGYDAPKFVEAVVRIARGQDPRSAYSPVIRFDEDVQVCEKSLDILIAAYEHFLADNANLYFFFSGCYGDPENPNNLDTINDRAVRAHWFSDKTVNEYVPNDLKIKLFWRDLGEVGATQLDTNEHQSVRGLSLIGERGYSANRRRPQVISGAGLIMSLRAIQDLPPFMNVNRLIVWVDDHLKRQLHERINDIATHDLESVTGARFTQCRHPDGVQEKDIRWASTEYFERLLAGCLMDALISQPAVEGNRFVRKPTGFTEAIKNVIAIPATQINFDVIEPELRAYVEQRYDLVLWLWQTPEFEGTVLHEWAYTKIQDTDYRNKQIKEILNDAHAYLDLVKVWRVSFAAAIGRLRPIGNLWLFERVPE